MHKIAPNMHKLASPPIPEEPEAAKIDNDYATVPHFTMNIRSLDSDDAVKPGKCLDSEWTIVQFES
ncbi:MAG: hypothetical protein ACRCSF_07075 [Mycobacteriaceae bacterium]